MSTAVKGNIGALLLAIVSIYPGVAQNDSIGSSRHLGNVVVTGVKGTGDVRHLSQTVTVIDHADIESDKRASLLPLINENAPGVFITSRGVLGYGVSGGAAGGISIRGLSGANARMMVLVDGHPQYAGIFGHPISDAYQPMLAERVEVLRGPASVLYGSNAMSGVINIITKQSAHNGLHTDFRAGYGSYNTLESSISSSYKKDRLTVTAGGAYNRTDGHRANSCFNQISGFGKVSYSLSENWSVYGDIDLTHFNASNPGPVSAPLEDADQSISRGAMSVSVNNRYARTSGGVSYFYNWGNHYINDGYVPSKDETARNTRFKSRDNMMGVSVYQTFCYLYCNRITAGFDWFRYGGNAWNKIVTGENSGNINSLVDKHLNEFAGYAEIRQDISDIATLNAGIRLDHHSALGNEWIPQFGAVFHLPVDVKLSASKGFRYPILREMYMFPPQNPDLRPESMWNYEIGMSQYMLDGRLNYEINLFYIDGKNLIETRPNPSGAGMLNQNSGQFRIMGTELKADYRINRLFDTNINYSYLHTDRRMIAAPRHKIFAGGSFHNKKWRIDTGVQYVAGLYTDETAGKSEHFMLCNLKVEFRIIKQVSLWMRGENLLAAKYEINKGYTMPRATVMAGVSLNI